MTTTETTILDAILRAYHGDFDWDRERGGQRETWRQWERERMAKALASRVAGEPAERTGMVHLCGDCEFVTRSAASAAKHHDETGHTLACRLRATPPSGAGAEAIVVTDAMRVVLRDLGEYCDLAAGRNECCDSCTGTWRRRAQAIEALLAAAGTETKP